MVIAGLALPTATASYSLFALAAIGREVNRTGENVAPALTVSVALVLAFLTFGSFVALVQRALDSIQIGGILRGLMRSAYRVIDDVHPHGQPEPLPDDAAPSAATPAADVLHDGPPGVVASVDRAALVRLAGQTGAFVEVVPMIGQYIPPGMVVLRLSNVRHEPDPDAARRVLVMARQRTIDQDPAFGLRMLVDVAIRALSPAVNDPTTAVQAIDRLEALLVELHGRHTGPSLVVDEEGAPRGRFPAPTWGEYLDLGLIEIRHYGGHSARWPGACARCTNTCSRSPASRIASACSSSSACSTRRWPQPSPTSESARSSSRPDRLGLGSA